MIAYASPHKPLSAAAGTSTPPRGSEAQHSAPQRNLTPDWHRDSVAQVHIKEGTAGKAGKPSSDRNSALQWLMAKENQELDVMRGQSSSWFFIEELSIGMISVNVTLSLTSSLDLSGVSGCVHVFVFDCYNVSNSGCGSVGADQIREGLTV